MAVGTRMQQRRGSEADWNVSNYVLAAGELGVTTDTGILKIGDGTTAWTDLPIAFDSQYLPLLGKAADSELLDGIGSENYAKVVDVPTNDAMATAIETAKDEAVIEAKQTISNRSVTDVSTTLQLADEGHRVTLNSTSLTVNRSVTIPADSTLAFPVGAEIMFLSIGAGSWVLSPAAGVTLRGNGMIYGQNSVVKLLKTGTDAWAVIGRTDSPPPRARRYVTSGFSVGGSANVILPLAGDDSTFPAYSKNYDSLGNQWSSGANDRLVCRREGYYRVHGQYSLLSVLAGKRLFVELDVNGTVQYLGQGRSSAASNTGAAGDFRVPLFLGDFVRLIAWQDDAARAISNVALSSSYLEWEWAGPL
jgi:hypothetical protein